MQSLQSFYKMTGRALVATLVLVGGAVAANAQFTTINPGGVVSPINNVAGGSGFNAAGLPLGDVFVSNFASAFSGSTGTQTIAGNLISAVFRTTTNTLDFAYQVQVNAGSSTGPVTTYSLTSFLSGSTPVGTALAESGQDISGTGVFNAAVTGYDNASRSGTGSGISPNTSGSGIGPGGSGGNNSFVFLVRTNATTFINNGSAGILGNGVSANTANTMLAPASIQAPEAGTLTMIGLGLVGGLGMVIRRRKN